MLAVLSSPIPSLPLPSPAKRSRVSTAGLLRVLAFTLKPSLLPSLLLAYTSASKIDAGRSRSTTNEGDAAVRLRTNTCFRDPAVSAPVEVYMR